jgi:KipI family sensor histidine kinase inhibitor
VTDVGPRIAPLGDAALVVRVANAPGAPTGATARALARALAATSLPGLVECVPAPESLVLHYRPGEIDYATIRQLVAAVLRQEDPGLDQPPPQRITVPVRYDGPDLPEVARATGLSVEEIVARHAGREYVVAMLGFVPGFAYLSDLDPALALPRRATPRTRVPAGSVAIAGGQTAIYPAATPGGWHLIGSTDLAVFDPARDPPALFAAGDRVQFRVERP